MINASYDDIIILSRQSVTVNSHYGGYDLEFLCINFINTNWYKTHKENRELLDDSSWLESFQVKWKLQTGASPKEKDIINLKELRAFLESAINKIIQGNNLSQEQLIVINKFLSLSVLNKSIEIVDNKYISKLNPLNRNWDWVLYEITVSFVELIISQDIKRIKLCENPECKWIFFDESKSRTRRWCDNTCASLIKVRKFRERGNK